MTSGLWPAKSDAARTAVGCQGPSLVGVGEHELCWLVARAERQLVALGLIDRPSLQEACAVWPPR